MDRQEIESIRNANFREVRRGWDRREVEQYLDGLADWLESGAADESGTYAVQKKLERVGQTVGRVLATAEQEAEGMRTDAREQAKRLREDARAEAVKSTELARAKAKRAVDETERRRKAVETVIADLAARRDELVAEIERLTRELQGKPAPSPKREAAESGEAAGTEERVEA